MNYYDERLEPTYNETVSIETYYESEALRIQERNRRIEAEEDLEWVISKILKAETMEELRKSLNEEKLI